MRMKMRMNDSIKIRELRRIDDYLEKIVKVLDGIKIIDPVFADYVEAVLEKDTIINSHQYEKLFCWEKRKQFLKRPDNFYLGIKEDDLRSNGGVYPNRQCVYLKKGENQ